MYKSQKTWNTIGIIGGYGPKASAYFLNLLIDICARNYGASDDVDYPPIYYISNPENVISSTNVMNKSTLISNIRTHISALLESGCRVLAIPCNTIYSYSFDLEWENYIVSLPLETANEALARGLSKVVMLGGEELRQNKTFDQYFTQNNIAVYYPNDIVQNRINNLILNVMGGLHGSEDFQELQNLIAEYKQNKFDGVIVGCSELSVLINSITSPAHVIDSMQVLALSTLRRASITNLR